jgi:hypothetical protein
VRRRYRLSLHLRGCSWSTEADENASEGQPQSTQMYPFHHLPPEQFKEHDFLCSGSPAFPCSEMTPYCDCYAPCSPCIHYSVGISHRTRASNKGLFEYFLKRVSASALSLVSFWGLAGLMGCYAPSSRAIVDCSASVSKACHSGRWSLRGSWNWSSKGWLVRQMSTPRCTSWPPP